jgi:integrase
VINYLQQCLPRQKRRPLPSRQRFLFPEEWERVRTVLDGQPIKIRVYFCICLMTGARMSEVRLMQWRCLDLTVGLWYKPLTKPGRAHILPLGEHILALLESLPRDTPFVFHGDLTNGHVNPEGPWSRRVIFYHWQKIRRLASVEDVTIHDLRRTLGSWMTMYGENLPTVQQVLDHRNIQTTMVYARLDQRTVRDALDRQALRVIGTAKPPHSARVTTQQTIVWPSEAPVGHHALGPW